MEKYKFRSYSRIESEGYYIVYDFRRRRLVDDEEN